MNKQKLIEEIKNEKLLFQVDDISFGYNSGIDDAIDIIKEFDEFGMTNNSTPSHYQGTIQPIDLINAQDLNFNLGNVVKYVSRAGKKQGENILSDLEKAKNYINFEIERVSNEQKTT